MNFNWEGKVILVVEDEIANYLFIEKVIETTHAKVFHASNGNEAIEYVKNDSSIDLVLMDIHMPGMNGIDATKAIKLISPKVPVVIQTCYDKFDQEKLKGLEYNGFVQKPINITKLLAIIGKNLSLSYSYE